MNSWKWHIILYLLIVCHTAKATNNFIIDKKMRCQPATDFLIKKSKADSLVYVLPILNNQIETEDILVEIPIQLIDKINVTQYENGIQKQHYNFISKNFDKRLYYDRNVAFPFTLAAHQQNNILFTFHDNDFHSYSSLKILIWKKDAKFNRTQALELTRGAFYGILALYIFICLLLTLFVRAKNYLYYCAYLFVGAAYLFIKNNLAYELLWPNYPNIDLFFKKIILSLYLITSLIFLKGFLSKRVFLPQLQNILRYFIYFGLVLVGISFIVGILSNSAQHTFIIIQNIFVVISFITMIFTFLISFLNSNDRSLILFAFIYFVSFSFFLFYPQPEFGRDVFGVYIGQIYTYSNAFILGAIISVSAVYRLLQIIRNNEQLKKDMSNMHAQNNFSLIEGQLNERKRVGQELHDGIGIMLSATKMKISSIKAKNTMEEIELKEILKNTDEICNNIRNLSHVFLPPTLQKFGLLVALKDLLENFKINSKINFTYNLNIPAKISIASQSVLYDFVQNLVTYFSYHKAEQLSINVYVLSSIKEAQIRVQCTGTYINEKDDKIQSIISVVDLLHGKHTIEFINAFNAKMHIEIPILID